MTANTRFPGTYSSLYLIYNDRYYKDAYRHIYFPVLTTELHTLSLVLKLFSAFASE